MLKPAMHKGARRMSPVVTATAILLLVMAAAAAVTFLLARTSAPSSRAGLAQGSSSRWSPVPGPTVGVPSALSAVTCAAPASCLAAGYAAVGGLPTALVESWNGTAWSVDTTAHPGFDSWLNSVACGSPTTCVAVGGYSITGDGDNPEDHTLVEMRSGATWTVVPSPNPGTGDESGLQSVVCTSPTWCVAVGSSSPISDPYNPPAQTLVESWDGTAWSVVPSPNPAVGSHSVLQSVACTSPVWCVAVGSYTAPGDTGSRHALAETWDGSAWSMVASPGVSAALRSQLDSVACPAPGWCTAVGSTGPGRGTNNPDTRTLVEVRDGSAWSVVPSPDPGNTGQGGLVSVTCTARASCVAAGSYAAADDLESGHPLLESWDGTRWSITPTPASNGAFASVACALPASCLAVGRTAVAGSVSANTSQTLIEAWHGM